MLFSVLPGRGRADLEAGKDWIDKLRQEQQAQHQQRTRQDRGQGMSR